MPDETKICEVCDQEIGKSEEKCPRCGTIFAELDAELQVVERAQKVFDKRKAKIVPPPPAPAPTPKKKSSVFASLKRGSE